jgi:protoporphyrinogen IX oxidase
MAAPADTASNAGPMIVLGVVVVAAIAAGLLMGDAAYPWLKALHVVAVIAWMAGLLYLPRLFVYHADAKPGSELSETLKVMERRLLTVIISPSMVLVWALGLYLAWNGGWFSSGWMHGKLLLVVLLSGLSGFLSKATREFANDTNTRSARFYRFLNEAPAVLMVLIVLLVVVKPF